MVRNQEEPSACSLNGWMQFVSYNSAEIFNLHRSLIPCAFSSASALLISRRSLCSSHLFVYPRIYCPFFFFVLFFMSTLQRTPAAAICKYTTGFVSGHNNGVIARFPRVRRCRRSRAERLKGRRTEPRNRNTLSTLHPPVDLPPSSFDE